jgi:amyloid beta precursor protein binding protein 1
MFFYRTLIPLSKKLWDLEIPFIVCRSYGFIGYIRVQVAEHTVIETHPDDQIPDLRLDKPFPSLKEYIDSIDLEAMEYKDHAHVPYLIILYKYLQQWKAEHNGQLPKNYKEKDVFRSMIQKGVFANL